ncbi:MAG: carboxypeptidase regulatory-like domain-containing protein, partial [Thermoanaerobaculia bacterium]
MRAHNLRRTFLGLALLLAALAARGGTITGRLLDGNGKPVAGSRVLQTAYREDDELLLEQSEGTTPAVLGQTKTDETGRFRVTLEKPGVPVGLRVITPGFPEARISGPYDSTDTADLADLRLPAAAKLTVRAADEAGRPVPAARVIVVAGAFAQQGDVTFLTEARTGPDGAAAMIDAPEGARAFSARAAGFVAFSRFALEQRGEERIVLRRGGVVRGTVTDTAGKPVEGAIVTCEDSAARTDASGSYRLSGVPLGSRTVETVWKEDFAAREEAVKVQRDADAEAPLKLAKAAAVAGTVIEESTRKPLPGARISVLNPGFSFGRRRAQRVTRTDGKGRFRAGGLGARHYTIEASREGYLTASIPNVNAATASPGTVAIALQKAASVAGFVRDEKGQAVVGARVRIQRDFNLRGLARGGVGALLGQQTVLTGPDGAFLLRGLTAQRGASLEATKAGFAAAQKMGVSWKTGEQVKDLVLTMKAGLVARGKVVDAQGLAVAGAQITTSRRDTAGGGRGGMVMRMANPLSGEQSDAVSGADGTFVVRGLDDGEYTASVARDGFARKTVASLT